MTQGLTGSWIQCTSTGSFEDLLQLERSTEVWEAEVTCTTKLALPEELPGNATRPFHSVATVDLHENFGITIIELSVLSSLEEVDFVCWNMSLCLRYGCLATSIATLNGNFLFYAVSIYILTYLCFYTSVAFAPYFSDSSMFGDLVSFSFLCINFLSTLHFLQNLIFFCSWLYTHAIILENYNALALCKRLIFLREKLGCCYICNTLTNIHETWSST